MFDFDFNSEDDELTLVDLFLRTEQEMAKSRLTPVAAEAASVTASEGDDTDRRPAALILDGYHLVK